MPDRGDDVSLDIADDVATLGKLARGDYAAAMMVDGRNSMAGAAQADLTDRLGRDRVVLGEMARKLCGFDPSSRDGPVAVVRPCSAEQVEHVVRIGRLRHLPVEVRGHLPALLPDDLRDAIVLDSSGLCRPPTVDISRRVVTVGAGIDLAIADRAARQARLCLRTLPGTFAGESVGALLSAGDPGELGLGNGSLLSDVVSAQVVTGSARVLRLGASDLFGQPPWLADGVPQPLPLLLGAEGRMAVLCEVTLRLHRTPHVSWSQVDFTANRPQLLAILSAARTVVSMQLCDTVLVQEHQGQGHLAVRAVTWRGADELVRVCAQVQDVLKQHGIQLPAFVAEDPRTRLGQAPMPQVRQPATRAATLDLRVAWPDVSAVLDVVDALAAEGGPLLGRRWSLGMDFMRLQCTLPGTRADLHPLVQRISLIADAGALPISSGARLRTVSRERMAAPAKILLAALARAWDPDAVLSPKGGFP